MKAKKLIAALAVIMMSMSVAPAYATTPVSAAEIVDNQNISGFTINLDEVKEGSDDQYTSIEVSYFGKGAERLEEEDGLTLAYRVKYRGEWFGWTPVNAYVTDEKDGKSTVIQDYVSDEVQFCVTKQPYPKIPAYSVDLSEEGMNEAITEPVTLNNPEENKLYNPAPYVIKATPVFTSTFNILKNKTAKVTLKFSEQLKETGTPSVSVTTTPGLLNYEVSNISVENGSENVTTGDINWQRDYAIVSFDMELDDVYDAQFAEYKFQVNGLEGVTSGKAPNSFGYTTSFYDCVGQIAPFCEGWGSIDQKIYMSPSLTVADYAIDPNNFYYDKNDYNQFTTNVFLVAVREDGKEGTFALKYNQSQAVDKLRQNYQATLAVPYPEGFNARQTNVEFRAYKFNNKDGAVTVTELPTRITEKGLEVSQNTFGFEQ